MANLEMSSEEFWQIKRKKHPKYRPVPNHDRELEDVDDHGDSTYTMVFTDNTSFWKCWYLVLKEEGIQTWGNPVEYWPVKPVEKTITVYEPI